MADLRIFVECSTKAVFDSRLTAGDITNRHLVLIKSTNQIYHNGVYYGLSAEDAEKLSAVYNRKEFGYVSDGTNTFQSSSAEGTLTIKKSTETGEAMDVTATANGVIIKLVVAEGSTNGTISFNGTDVAVHGLGSAAFTDSTAYATAAQGTLADNAVPQTTEVNGHALTGNITITKGDVGLGNVDNESKATMFTSPEFTGTPIAPTAAVGTNTQQLATTAFVKAEIDDKMVAAQAMQFKGVANSASDLSADAIPGWTYRAGTAFTLGSEEVEVGDMIICLTKKVGATDPTWGVIQNNIDGAVTGPSSSVDTHVAIFDGATGKVIKDSGYTIAKSVPSTAVFTDTQYTFTSGSDGSFTVTPHETGGSGAGSAQTVSIGKPATAGTADQVGHTLTITKGDGSTATFDGSADASASILSNDILMGTTGHTYTKPGSVTSAISSSDSVQAAIGKLEAMFDWVVYDTAAE